MMKKSISLNKDDIGGLKKKFSDMDCIYVPRMTAIFDSYKGKVARGKLQIYYYEKAIPFTGLDQLLMIIEDIMDLAGYPQSNTQHRDIVYFDSAGAKRYFFDIPEIKVPDTFAEFCEKSLEMGEWYLQFRIYYRQHSSMQGVMLFKDREIYFRSGIEFIRLIHEFLNHTQLILQDRIKDEQILF